MSKFEIEIPRTFHVNVVSKDGTCCTITHRVADSIEDALIKEIKSGTVRSEDIMAITIKEVERR